MIKISQNRKIEIRPFHCRPLIHLTPVHKIPVNPSFIFSGLRKNFWGKWGERKNLHASLSAAGC